MVSVVFTNKDRENHLSISSNASGFVITSRPIKVGRNGLPTGVLRPVSHGSIDFGQVFTIHFSGGDFFGGAHGRL